MSHICANIGFARQKKRTITDRGRRQMTEMARHSNYHLLLSSDSIACSACGADRQELRIKFEIWIAARILCTQLAVEEGLALDSGL